jgi:hypothetical protein
LKLENEIKGSTVNPKVEQHQPEISEHQPSRVSENLENISENEKETKESNLTEATLDHNNAEANMDGESLHENCEVIDVDSLHENCEVIEVQDFEEPTELQTVLDQYFFVLGKIETETEKTVTMREAKKKEIIEDQFQDNFNPSFEHQEKEENSVSKQVKPTELRDSDFEIDEVSFTKCQLKFEKSEVFESKVKSTFDNDFTPKWENLETKAPVSDPDEETESSENEEINDPTSNPDIDEELGIVETPKEPKELSDFESDEVTLRPKCQMFIEKEFLHHRRILPLKKRSSTDSEKSFDSKTEIERKQKGDDFEDIELQSVEVESVEIPKSVFKEIEKMDPSKDNEKKKKKSIFSRSKKDPSTDVSNSSSKTASLKSEKGRNKFFSASKSSSELSLPQLNLDSREDVKHIDSNDESKEPKKHKSLLSRGKKLFSSGKKSKSVKNSTEDLSSSTEEPKKSKKSKSFGMLKSKDKSTSLPDISEVEKRKSLSVAKSLKKSFKSLTAKTSTYVVNPESEPKSNTNKNKLEGNARLKIGNSSFFVPAEESSFSEEFNKTLERETEMETAPVPPIRKKRKEKMSDLRLEKNALEILQHLPAIQNSIKSEVKIAKDKTSKVEQNDEIEETHSDESSVRTLVDSPEHKETEKDKDEVNGLCGVIKDCNFFCWAFVSVG